MISEPGPRSAPGPRRPPRPQETAPARRPGREHGNPVAEPVKLTDAKGMRALAHPVRMALIELFSFRQTLTATQASEALGESPATCAFHLRTLAKYGFVHEAGGGRGRERPWALTNRYMSVNDADQSDPQAALAASELSRYWLERWIERTWQAFGSRNQVPAWNEATGWTSSHAFLTPGEVVKLRAEMRQIVRRYEHRLADPARRPEGALPVEWTIFASPVFGEAGPDALVGQEQPDAAAPDVAGSAGDQ